MWVSHHVRNYCRVSGSSHEEQGASFGAKSATHSHCHVHVPGVSSDVEREPRHRCEADRRNSAASGEVFGRGEAGQKGFQRSKWTVLPREERVS